MSINKVLFIGAGGHARALAAIAYNNPALDIIGFLDINSSSASTGENICGYPVFKCSEDILCDINAYGADSAILSVGDNLKRKSLFEVLSGTNIALPNLISSNAEISIGVMMGRGNTILSGAFIGCNALIGDNNIINTRAIIEHEAIIGSHNHFAPSSILLGRVRVGNGNFIGSSSVLREKVTINDDIVIGASSFVGKCICDSGVYVGGRARRIK